MRLAAGAKDAERGLIRLFGIFSSSRTLVREDMRHPAARAFAVPSDNAALLTGT
jgi:hypothetical protein